MLFLTKVTIHGLAISAITAAIISLIFGCGREDQVPTQLTADPKTGEVSLKGEKGEKGDPGQSAKDGTNGKDGIDGKDGQSVTGKDGKDGKDGVIDTTWVDPVSGKRWLLSGIKVPWNANYGCDTWTKPDSETLRLAIYHGLIRALPPSATLVSTDYAWTTTANPDNPTTEGRAFQLTTGGEVNQLKTLQQFIYCYKP